jgi:outer membrane protein assembly factor BamB
MWPALVLMAIIVLARYVPRFIEGASSQVWYVPVFFPLLASALMLVWWLAGSRATGREKLIGFLGFILALAVIVALSHASMRGLITTYLTVPLGMLGFGLGALSARSLPPQPRARKVLLLAVLAMSITLFLQSYGITGAYAFELHSRWASAPGSGSWAKGAASIAASAGTKIEAAIATAEWPAFRGADRMGHTKAPTLATDWQANPPKLLWKKAVGAGWSSFAVAGPFAFTQEQRGPSEVVACYEVATGNEVWTQQREARFDEPMGGPGPRATPTLADGAVFVTSATGVLLRLKASTGEVVWQQDFKSLSGRAAMPMWGFSASPLVTGSLVVIYAGGSGDKGVMAFDAASGESKWSVACGPESYSSPQLSKVLGEDTLLMLTNDGLLMLDPVTGKVRLNYEWKFQGYRALQPTVIGDVILLPTPMSEGTRAIRVSKKGDQLAAEELWTSKQLKTDFSDLIAHKAYLYGIDGSMFSCIDLTTGARVWKDGRYGKGQAVLLDSADQILIAAEDGRVVLLQADPTAHKEITSFQALKGKTWNHPVVVGDKLLVRNATETACYALPLAPEPAR